MMYDTEKQYYDLLLGDAYSKYNKKSKAVESNFLYKEAEK